MGLVVAKHAKLSKRRACSWLRLRRSTIYGLNNGGAGPIEVHSDAYLIDMMKKVRREQRAWGFRMIFAYLKNQGERIGKTRAHRLYQQAKLSLHRNPKKPRIKRVFQKLLPPEQINEGWAMDFLSEWVIGDKQQSVRIINVVDECSRKDLWVEAAHSITAAKLIETLDRIVEMRGWGCVQISVSGLFFQSFFRPSKSKRAGVYGGVADFDGRKKGLWSKVWSYSVSEVNVQLRES